MTGRVWMDEVDHHPSSDKHFVRYHFAFVIRKIETACLTEFDLAFRPVQDLMASRATVKDHLAGFRTVSDQCMMPKSGVMPLFKPRGGDTSVQIEIIGRYCRAVEAHPGHAGPIIVHALISSTFDLAGFDSACEGKLREVYPIVDRQVLMHMKCRTGGR